ncbi:uncharacterized protein METZ01_LOCUS347222, partial [marine metagenome]
MLMRSLFRKVRSIFLLHSGVKRDDSPPP